MTNPLTVALVQYPAAPFDKEKNLSLAARLCREAKASGADLILFPEMWNIGYAFPAHDDANSLQEWTALAEPDDGETVSTLRTLAKELSIGIVITCLSEGTPAPQNTAYLIANDGSLLLKYSKVHTCDFSGEYLLTPGSGFEVCDFPFQGGSVKIGIMICYDGFFPEVARELSNRGAEVVAWPVWGCNPLLARARACENHVYLVSSGYGYPTEIVGPDGETLHYLTGGPIYVDGKRLAGKSSTAMGEAKGLEDLHLITYDVAAGKYKDHGAIFYENGQRPLYVNSIAVGKNGALFFLARITENGKTRTDLVQVEKPF